jgi:dCTP deaminase
MILTGKEIIKRRKAGDIVIDPFDEKKVNPNSYNLSLHNELLCYIDKYLDMKKDNAMYKVTIPEDGHTLYPNKLYLARTKEYTETYNLVPVLNGRSSIGRLGITIHVTAGYGDIGFCGHWTLEIMVINPIRVYPDTEICQIYYNTVVGEQTQYAGKYQGSRDIIQSKLYKEFEDENKI